MEHPSVHLLSLVNDILIEICKTKTTANQSKGKYHQEPIKIQSEKQASCLKRGKTGSEQDAIGLSVDTARSWLEILGQSYCEVKQNRSLL